MANQFDRGKQKPYPLTEGGKGYNRLLLSRSQAILNSLVNLLASNYEASVVGPNYTVYMKAMATELARITIILEQLGTDISPGEVRSEFLWETVGYLVFLNQQIPELEFDDESFREFLERVVEIYFEGSTPEAIRKGIDLFTSDDFVLRENFKDDTLDISDQFGFSIDFELQGTFPSDMFKMDRNIRLLLEIIRPAHTLYRLRFILKDDADIIERITDASEWSMQDYHYDDTRFYCRGMAGFASDTGVIEVGSTSVLTDVEDDKPLQDTKVGVTLLIADGPNTGRYTVIGHPDEDSVRVFPRFKVPEDPVSYQVEVDRLGRKREIYHEDNVSSQFYATDRITVDGGGPYAANTNEEITLTASSNGVDAVFTWDLDSSNQFATEGQSVQFTAPSDPGTVIVWVKVEDYRGRKAKARVEINVS